MPGLGGPSDLLASLPALFAPVADYHAIGLAVSGGADSLALMVLMQEWATHRASSPRIVVYSVDHGLRPEAADEVAFVVRGATRLGLAARALRWVGDKPQAGVQAAARAARYRLMRQAMREDGVEVLLTAHHRDDQAETVLMRLAHGSGLDGLRGMGGWSDIEGVRVFRPLLGVPSGQLRDLVSAAGLMPVVDPSNADRHYERVRWRQIMPGLADAGLDAQRLSQFARRAGDAEQALDQWAAEQFAQLVTVDPLGAAVLPHARFAALPRAVGVRLLARLLASVGSGRSPHALGVIERLHDRLTGAAVFSPATQLGAAIRKRGDTLWFSREAGRHTVLPTAIAAGESLLWDGRFSIANGTRDAIAVQPALHLTRNGAERLVGRAVAAPASAIHSAPFISGSDGAPLALGRYGLRAGVSVEFAGGLAEVPQS